MEYGSGTYESNNAGQQQDTVLQGLLKREIEEARAVSLGHVLSPGEAAGRARQFKLFEEGLAGRTNSGNQTGIERPVSEQK